MRQKLQKFSDFAASLLPYELVYLLSCQRFKDPVRKKLLEQVYRNCQLLQPSDDYDTTIDKRKYSNLKSWIIERLKSIDVDAHFEWMMEMEKKIMTDAIEAKEEKLLLKQIKKSSPSDFYFTKFYELAEQYRHFLLIRLRYRDHKMVNDFLLNNREKYLLSKVTHQQIHTATLDIVDQYSGQPKESIQWEKWLTGVFYNEEMDGFNRYLALVRLVFIYLNYRKFDQLEDKYNYLTGLFQKGIYYSRRLLLNFHGNQLLLYSKFKDYEKAAYYGYLSIRGKSHDYLLYINNLSAVLLRQDKYEEAFQILKSARKEMKQSENFFNKIGYVSFYIKCLNQQKKYPSAESYAESFLRAYKREILNYRWHIFFSTYLETLLLQEKYSKILKVARKHHLNKRDETYQKRADYLPSIAWFFAVAQYKELQLNREELTQLMRKSMQQLQRIKDKKALIDELFKPLEHIIPGIIHDLKTK